MSQIIILTGATHTGKTRLAQRLLEKHRIPYVSEDHIKMGMIRSGYTDLTVRDDDKMTAFLWPVIREMIKTAIENEQDLIVEGCYIPFDWKSDFSEEYLRCIRYCCLCMSERYIDAHFADIRAHANCIEKRLDDSGCTVETLKRENMFYMAGCKAHGLPITWIDDSYIRAVDAVFDRII